MLNGGMHRLLDIANPIRKLYPSDIRERCRMGNNRVKVISFYDFGHPRKVNLRAILNAILMCNAWASIGKCSPYDFPPAKSHQLRALGNFW
jgi:hypothetical protein